LLTADAELHRLTDLLLYNGLPNRSAQILESVISERSGVDPSLDRKLGESWAAAGELDKAVAPLERVAAAAASGDAFVRLAELHVERRDWRAAIDALAHALKKGDLEDPARAALLTGVALFGMSHYAEAREWFTRAAGADVYRQTANDYIEAIDARVG
jgi:tetratricopeptide (TPR) repeat protein